MQIQSMMNNHKEQRRQNDEQGLDWENLTLSQQFSISSLGKFGYILAFIRLVNGNSLAVLKLDNKVATINVEGMINIKPNLVCRG